MHHDQSTAVFGRLRPYNLLAQSVAILALSAISVPPYGTTPHRQCGRSWRRLTSQRVLIDLASDAVQESRMAVPPRPQVIRGGRSGIGHGAIPTGNGFGSWCGDEGPLVMEVLRAVYGELCPQRVKPGMRGNQPPTSLILADRGGARRLTWDPQRRAGQRPGSFAPGSKTRTEKPGHTYSVSGTTSAAVSSGG